MGGQIFTIYTSNDADLPKDVLLEGVGEKTKCSGYQNPMKPPKVGVVGQFQAQGKKNWIFIIFKTTSQISRTLKATNAPYKSANKIPR